MNNCQDCRYLQDLECTWWLQLAEDVDWRNCYVSLDSDPDYPLIPIPTRELRQFKYPEQHGHCFVCGAVLTGNKRAYCSSGHRQMYWGRFTWDGLRELIWGRDQSCLICNAPVTCYEAEIDHIKAVALDGNYWDPANLQTLCHECHAKKTGGDRTKITKKQWREAIATENYPLDLFMEL